MAGRAVPPVLRFLRALAPDAPDPDSSDAVLLASFLRRGDQDAFASLLRRHGPMVWGVCRRALPDVHSAEDAFQATFLVLLRKAGSLSRPERLANWLYGVACRTATKARTLHARRRQHERSQDADDFAVEAPPEAPDLRPALDEALAGLPEKYRAPLVLCYLEGKTYAEAARALGWAEGTVSGRLARAREVLRRRLAHTGLTLSAAGLASLLTPEALAAAPPDGVVSSALSAALRVAAGEAGAVSPQVIALTRGVLHAMFLSKLHFAGAVLLALAFVGAGASLSHRALARPADEPRAESAPPAVGPPPRDTAEPPPREKPAEAKAPTATSPDGKVKATGDGKAIRLFDVATGKELARMVGHADKVSALTFSPDGKFLVSGGLDRSVRMWDARVGREVRRLEARAGITALTFSPDGKTLTVTEGAKGKRSWDVATGKELRPAPKDAVEPPAKEKPAKKGPAPTVTSPDGRVRATGDGKSIRLSDVATGKELARMLGHADKVSALAFSPDGKVLASGGLDRTVGVWDVATGRMLMKMKARGAVTALAYSPDGKTLTARDGAKGKRAWDVATGKELP